MPTSKLTLTKRDLKKMESSAKKIILAFNKHKLQPRLALAVLLGVADNVMEIGKIDNMGHTTGKHRVEINRYNSDGSLPDSKSNETPSYIR